MHRKYSLTIGVVCVAAMVVSIAIAQQSSRRPGPNGNAPQRNDSQATKSRFGSDALKKPNRSFVLTSSAVKNQGKLPSEFTGDGGGSTLPLSWKGVPEGTKSYALIMDHQAPDGMKSYWTMWDIPATVTSLPKNTKGIGKVGGGFRGRLGYEPPNSKGPGEKIYVLTVYALSSPLQITQSAINVNRDILLAAMKDKVLASSSLSVSYTRTIATQSNGERGQGDRQRSDGGGQQGGGGDPVFRAIDSNGNGILEKAEIQNTPKAILSLDKNKDGKVAREELRGGGRGQRGRRQQGGRPPEGRRQGNGSSDQAGGPRGPQSADGPRQPWIVVHADEIDLDKNKIISRNEIVGEATKAFAAYDTNSDGKLSSSELSAGNRSRSAMGGFLTRHSTDIDRDGDGIMTPAEAVSNSERMFAKMDTNDDGNISADEMKASGRK